jgi:hypothetical protein
MLFIINNKRLISIDQLRAKTLLRAYSIIKNYELQPSDVAIDNYIKQQYKESLKNMCIKLLLNLTFYEDKEGNLVLLFKNPKYDVIASLITYGNGAIPGSKILRLALRN